MSEDPKVDEKKESDEKEFSPEEIRDEILLNMVEGIGSILSQNLYSHFTTARAILTASRGELLSIPGIGPRLAERLVVAEKSCPVDDLIGLCRREHIDIICKRDSRYPDSLKRIHDPPSILYQKGKMIPEDSLSIAVVGTRGITSYGRKMTTRLTMGLIDLGFTIIAGLARGVDTVAHKTALDAEGRTVAVLGSGLLNIFPVENKELSEIIIKNGALLSEFHPYMAPLAGNFPQRNRVVSGLSLGVLVVESPEKGGALITARLGMEQNKDIFAVPGPADSNNSHGCHQLIRDGATLVEKVDDILEVLGPLVHPIKHPSMPGLIRTPVEIKLNDLEKKVLLYIETTSISVEEIILQSGLLPHQVLAIISALEFRHLVIREEGGFVRRI